jgi:Ca-activated chloride channel family protein
MKAKDVFALIGCLAIFVVGYYSLRFVGEVLQSLVPAALSYGRARVTHWYRPTDPAPPLIIPTTYHQTGVSSKLYQKQLDGITVAAQFGSDSLYKDGYLMITLGADKNLVQPTQSNLPLNVAVVVDRSGSMSGEKLESVKNALLRLTNYLTPADKISLVVYDDKVQTLYSGAYQREAVVRLIASIETGGSTNLAGGLQEGLQKVQGGTELFSHFEYRQQSDMLNHVILLSDGLANVGMDSPPELAALVERYRNDGITVSTIGVGSDYDENIMTAIGRAGQGRYYFMESPTQAEQIFTEEMAQLDTVVAKDIKVSLDFNQSFQVKRGVGYEMSSANAFTPHNLSAGKEARYLFEIASRVGAGTAIKVGTVTVSYTAIKTGQRESIQIPLEIDVTTTEVNPLSDDGVYQEFMRSHVAEQLWQVDRHLDDVKNDEARSVLQSVRGELEAAARRMPAVFGKDLQSVEAKATFLEAQGSQDVQSAPAGRAFKKANQSESYTVQYNR